jgi:hypothetical protein
MAGPTVKSRRDQGDLILYIEGADGQRARLRVGGSTDLMRVFVEHDPTVDIETAEVETTRWWQ